MIHYTIGNLGHLFVIGSFVFSLLACFSYIKAERSSNSLSAKQWLQNGKTAFYLQVFSVLGISVTLFLIIFRHYFEYHYAYSYSDRTLPVYYLISTFWNGQEGSFLLWMFWNSLLGLFIIHTAGKWHPSVMAVFSLIQVFLATMILGVIIPGLDLKIGSSPFILLRDVIQDPAFVSNPNFVPADGTGLNPLLQNYWMVIHPPTLFLGFATTGVPFAFCIAGLWRKETSNWVRPALPWSLFSGAVLGLGILMGGYWAYETLNFGGYWNWDPVENAVYVPWLILIAAIHLMITYKNSETALRASVIMVVTVFVLILYSTFLTRSGVLGDASVHSFTDLGLSGQLLIYLFTFLIGSIVLIAARWKLMPKAKQESSVYSREFWIFIGAAVLILMGFQVLLPTSIPVWNRIVEAFGVTSNVAPPADQIAYYSKFQLWFAVAVALLSAVGQFFWWKKIDPKKLKNELIYPLLISGVLLVVILEFIVSKEGGLKSASYIFLLFAGIFTIAANSKILISLFKSSPGLSGGAIAHMGVGLVLIGILFSAGYSKIVSLNNTGMLISRDFDEANNRDNLLLFLNEPRNMAGYEIEYVGERWLPRSKSGYIDKNQVYKTTVPGVVVAKQDLEYDGNKIYNKGDTITIAPENTYFDIEFSKDGKKRFELFPRVQTNAQMGGFIASPAITRSATRDIYTTVSAQMLPESKEDWSEMQVIRVPADSIFYVNDYVADVEDVLRISDVDGQDLAPDDIAVKAVIKVKGEEKEYTAEPIFIIRGNQVARLQDVVYDLGVRFSLVNIHPETGDFSIGFETRQKDWVVIKAVEKPYINLLWIGTGLIMFGFCVAMTRRIREFRKMKAKDLD